MSVRIIAVRPVHPALAVLAVLLVGAVLGCARPRSQPPVPATREALVGAWRHRLPDHETYELVLFDTGVVGFIHAGEKLPIRTAFGRWSFDEGTLDLNIVGSTPEDVREMVPLANRIIVTSYGAKLVFDMAGERTSWWRYDRYGDDRAGAAERRASDERGWTTQVEQAEAAQLPATAMPESP